MLFQIGANLLVVIHLLFILFVLFGGFWAIRRRYLLFAHLPAALWGTLIEFYGWTCPLTPWEQTLRHLSGQAGYSEGFIAHYLLVLIYPEMLTRNIQLFLGLLVVSVNILAYTILIIRLKKNRVDFIVNKRKIKRSH